MSTHNKPGCLGAILQLFGASPKTVEPEKEECLPYRLRDDFLSSAELSFYHVLQQAASDWAVVCPKISLDDLFYAKSGQRSTNQAYLNKIDRKHVDFLLCHPRTMRPLLGIELDDASHRQSSRLERDRFVEQVFSTAGLPLFRQPVRPTYNVRELAITLRQQAGLSEAESSIPINTETMKSSQVVPQAVELTHEPQTFESSVSVVPSLSPDGVPGCPRCGQLMVLRTAQKDGLYKGNKFWGCKDYPHCRGIRAYP